MSEPKIFGVKLHLDNGCYRFSFRHTGDFRLNDYEELDLEVMSAKLVKRKY